MKCKQIAKLIMAVLLVLMVVASPALAATKNSYEVVKGEANNDDDVSEDDEHETNNDESVSDKLISDDKFLGYDINEDYDVSEDLSLQRGFDLASSLPIWSLYIIGILLLAILVIGMIATVILYNTYKGGRAAVKDNPNDAAKGIKDTKMVTREYMGQALEAIGCLALLYFVVNLIM